MQMKILNKMPIFNSAYLISSYLLLTVFITADVVADEKVSYTFARAPQLTTKALFKQWNPLVERLSKELDINIQLKLYKNRKSFLNDVNNGRVDFVYMNPYYTLKAHESNGYRPIIRDNNKKLYGILVAHKDSAIKSLEDLQGKVIAFPSPNALAASLYMRSLLETQHHISFTPHYVGSHDNVYLNVLLNKVSAGGGVMRTFNKSKNKNNLRIIYKTPALMPHPISVHPRVPEMIVEKLMKSILIMNKDEDGKKILKSIGLQHPTKADFKRDYNSLKQLELEKHG